MWVGREEANETSGNDLDVMKQKVSFFRRRRNFEFQQAGWTTKTEVQKLRATKFCTAAPDVCGISWMSPFWPL